MEVTDRITPYREGGSISERIDEIVAENATVHFEMMACGQAFMSITSNGVERRYCLWCSGGSLNVILQEEIALANQPGETFPEGARE